MSGTPVGAWNDYVNTQSCSYVIEYGGMPGDPEEGEDESTSGGSGDADVFVKVEVNVDPQGRTITTSADNVRLGQPLKISENVNGGDIEKLDSSGNKVPSAVTRIFYKKLEDGTWEQLEGEPNEVGTYKVESHAVYSDPVNSEEAKNYNPGSSQFKILSAVVDATTEADPDNEGQKTLTVRGTILPREVVLTPALTDDGGNPVTNWQVNKPVAGKVTPVDDLANYDAATGNPSETTNTNPTTNEQTSWVTGWNANMLAPGDTLDDVLAGVTIDYDLATAGGLALNEANPQLGTYLIGATFKGENVTFDSATKSYLVGNYRFTVGKTALKVNPKPAPTVINTEVTVDPADPGTGPVSDDDILDIVKGEVSPGAPDPKDPTKPVVPDVDPIITITKGKTVVDEIDPTEPGEYVITVTYPDPDGGPDTEVIIRYVVEPPAPDATETTYYTVTTRLRGSVDACTTLTPSASVKKGGAYQVSWSAGADRYVSLVEVDGKSYDAKNSSVDFSNITANHEVVVTVVKMPSAGSTVTPGWYTVTVNRYGGSEGLDAAPMRTVDAGGNYEVAWEPVVKTTDDPTDPDYAVYEVVRVTVNGADRAGAKDEVLQLDNIKADQDVMDDVVPLAFALASAVAPTFPPEVKVARAMTDKTARYDISHISSDHKVEVYFAKTDAAPVADDDAKKAKDDATTVTPTVEGGSGTITIGTKDPDNPDAEPEWGGQPDPDKETVVK